MITNTEYLTKALTNLGFVNECLSDDKQVTDWLGNSPIAQEEIDAEITRLQAEFDNAQYARDRAVAYPPMADQLDDIFHNGVAGWKETIQAVKDTYPKP